MANTRTHNGSLLSDVQNEAHFGDASYAVRSIDWNKVCLVCLVEGLNLSTKYLLRFSLGRVITTCAAFDLVFFLRSGITSLCLLSSGHVACSAGVFGAGESCLFMFVLL